MSDFFTICIFVVVVFISVLYCLYYCCGCRLCAQQSDCICVNMHREKVERPHHQSFQIYRTFSRYTKHFSDIQNIFQIYWTFPDIQIIFQIYKTSCPRKRFLMLSRFCALSVGFQRENPGVISFQVHNQGIITVPIDFDWFLLDLSLNTQVLLTLTPVVGIWLMWLWL